MGSRLESFDSRQSYYSPLIWSNYSDLTRPGPPKVMSNGNPLISGKYGKSRLVKYYI